MTCFVDLYQSIMFDMFHILETAMLNYSYLTSHPPYPDVVIRKLEDSNHFAKRMLNGIKKLKQENKDQLLSDGKRFTGKGRMTNVHAIKFKIYFAKAIRESKSDLDTLYKRSWTIFKHH